MDSRIVIGSLSLVLSCALTIYYLFVTRSVKKEDSLLSATMVLVFLTLSVMSLSWILLVAKEDEKDKEITLAEFMDFNNLTILAVIIGMIQGFVFGTIDNFGMALGLNGLESTLNSLKLSAGMIAGISNLYSSIFGSIMGAVLEKTIKTYSGIEDTPWWGNLLGIIFGSLFGLKISELVTE